jgi:hypothetical protein
MSFPLFRDVVTFLGGLVLAGYEVLTTPPDGEPSLVVLGLAATMMGLTGTLGLDRLLNRGQAAPVDPLAEPGPEPPALESVPDSPPNDQATGRRRHRR